LFISKSNTGKIYACIIPLSESDYHEVSIKTDGSKHEKMAKTIKLDSKYLNNLNPSDLITTYMIEKMKKFGIERYEVK
jgi:alpha-L-arabinofuranosidase